MSEIKKFYVYKITNLINNKIYIGKTYDPYGRWQSHLNTAKHKFSNTYSYIHKAINKYEKENFSFEIIFETNSEEESLSKEKEFILQYNSKNSKFGYNLTDGGDGISGFKYSDEQKLALSTRMKGRFDGELNPFFGQKHTDETRIKISKARKNSSNENYLGEKSSQAKLTEIQVIDIKTKYLEGIIVKELKKNYNVSKGCINSIIYNDTWKNVGQEINLTKEERKDLYLNSKFGKLKIHIFICKICKKEFTLSKREKCEFRSSNTYCRNECKYVDLKNNFK